MNVQIRRLAVGILVLYSALFVRLNVVQVYSAGDLNVREGNNRQVLRDFDRPRGKIQTSDGTVLAFTTETGGDGFEYQRNYPTGELFAQVTGYFTLGLGSTGVERSYGDDLSGQSGAFELRALTNLFDSEGTTGDVVLSMRNDVQETATLWATGAGRWWPSTPGPGRSWRCGPRRPTTPTCWSIRRAARPSG